MAWETTGNNGTNPTTNCLGTLDRQPLVIKTAGAEQLRVTEYGFIGIGTGNPSHALHVATKTNSGLRVTVGSGGVTVGSFGGLGRFEIDKDDVPGGRFIVSDNGNVGIGTGIVGVNCPLTFASTFGDKIALAGVGNLGQHFGFGVRANQLLIHSDGSASDILFGGGTSSSFQELMRIKGNGWVGIGTAEPGARLEINGDLHLKSSVTNNIRFQNAAGVTTARLASPGGGLFLNGGGPDVAIDATGKVGIGTRTPATALEVVTSANDDGISVSSFSNVAGFFLKNGPIRRGALISPGNPGQGSADALGGDVVLSTADASSRLLLQNGAAASALAIVGNKVGIGTANPQSPLSFPNTFGDKISLYGGTGDRYGFGIQSKVLQVYADLTASDIAFGYGSSSSFHQTMRVTGGGSLILGVDPAKGGYTALAMALSAPMSGYVDLQSIKSSGTAWGDLILNQRGGRVGIGTASPRHSLAIYYNGGPQWTTSLWGGAVELSNACAIAWTANAAGQRRGIGETNGGLHFFRTASDPGNTASPALYDMVITDAGDVGIGTQTPGAKLEVNGNIRVTGDIFLTNADCAEDFETAEAMTAIDPGTVMVIDQEGVLRPSEVAYDTKVAGVISGAGDYKPALILDRQKAQRRRAPVALMGKVYCKVDAQYAPIAVGDLLTTSPTPGYAMKASDPLKAFGAVIGKALRPLAAGGGLIPILVALQ